MPRVTGKAGDHIVVLGEDNNDRKCIKTLICALRPEISSGRVLPLREPIALVKDVSPAKIAPRARRVQAMLRAVDVQQKIRCVVMHEDADACEPAHEDVARRIKGAYKDLPWPVRPVVPAWEMETWWFLFPDAISALHKTWRKPVEYAGRDLGKIEHAKERFMVAVRPQNARLGSFHEYSESEAPSIAEMVVSLGLLRPPWYAKSASWQVFLNTVAEL